MLLCALIFYEGVGSVIQNSAEYEIHGEHNDEYSSEIDEVYLQEFDVGINIHIDDIANDNTKSIEYNEEIMKYIEINFI